MSIGRFWRAGEVLVKKVSDDEFVIVEPLMVDGEQNKPARETFVEMETIDANELKAEFYPLDYAARQF